MNRTAIEWTDYTWNPITGCTGCEVAEVCYARKFAQRLRGRFGYPQDEPFKPTFHPDRLDEPLKIKKPSRIFTCSMGDVFSEGVRVWWIRKVIRTMQQCPQHTFQILTKKPHRIPATIDFPPNCWLGVSITGGSTAWRLSELLDEGVSAHIRFASFEPLLSYDGSISLKGLDWVIIGAQTNPYRPPKKEWVDEIIHECRALGIPVFLKDNLQPIYGEDLIQEFPTPQSVYGAMRRCEDAVLG